METYRITFVNPAFAPRVSYQFTEAENPHEAQLKFWRNINPACVMRDIGAGGIIAVEHRNVRGAWVGSAWQTVSA